MTRWVRPVTSDEDVSLGDRANMPCPDGSDIAVVVADWSLSLMEYEREESPILWWAEA